MQEKTSLDGVSVLIVEDDAWLRRQVSAFLERHGADVTAVGEVATARTALTSMPFDFALLDVNLPDGTGTDLLRDGTFSPTTGVVVMTGQAEIAGAVEAMQLGALNYLTKPVEQEQVLLALRNARRERRARRIEQHRQADALVSDAEFCFGSGLADLRSRLERILSVDRRTQGLLAPVLIEGETGSGKTTIARWLHQHGPRADQPMIEVNCPALPETLAESELFGHERGAFTDARSARIGLFEAADGGTLFLDELSSLSLPLQAKVLTVIEDGRIRRLGGNKPIQVDVRVVAASNQGLRRLVNAGQFREDLFHRLDLFRLELPPLRERVADILPLAETLLQRICRRHRLPLRALTPEGQRRLEQCPWRGNVRELAHEIERAVVFEDGPLAFRQLQPADTETPPSPPQALAPEDWFNPAFRFPSSGFSLEEAVDRLVQHALQQSEGNVSAAARLLSVSRDVVRYRLSGKSGRTDGGASPNKGSDP